MHLRRRGKILYATVYVEGRRIERSTGCTAEEAAGAILGEWEREAADPLRATSNTTLNDVLTLLLDDRTARVANDDGSEATVSFSRRTSGHLVRYFGHDFRVVRLADSTQVWQCIGARLQECAKDTSIKKEVVTLRAGLR